MTRIEREKQTVRKMIELYCLHHLKEMCSHLSTQILLSEIIG